MGATKASGWGMFSQFTYIAEGNNCIRKFTAGNEEQGRRRGEEQHKRRKEECNSRGRIGEKRTINKISRTKAGKASVR